MKTEMSHTNKVSHCFKIHEKECIYQTGSYQPGYESVEAINDTKGKLLFNTFKLTCESQFHQSSDMVQNIWTSVILNLIFPHYQCHVISYCCYCVQKYGKLKDTVGLIDVASDCELQVTVMGFMNIHDITTCFDRR